MNPSPGLAAITEVSRSSDITLEIFHGYKQNNISLLYSIFKTVTKYFNHKPQFIKNFLI
jgi:hypothetical protein